MIILLILLLSAAIANCKVEYCYSESPDEFDTWGVRQAYNPVRGEINGRPNDLESCEVVNFWSILRHGARYPKPLEAEKMKKILVPLRDEITSSKRVKLCEEDVEAFKEWNFNEDLINKANNLTCIGWDESYYTGKRFASNFLNEDNFKMTFRSTPDSYTIDSLTAVYEGITDEDKSKHSCNVEKPRKKDIVIAPYDECKKWQLYQKEDAKAEVKKFTKSPLFQKLIKRVEKRLGVRHLTSDAIKNMWEICRFYKVILPEDNCPWCAAFRVDDFDILQYYDDLEQYYFASYGSDLNAKLGAITLKNLVEEFNSTVYSDNKDKTANIYVGHLTIVEMIMTALNIAKDDVELNTKNAKELIPSRKFKTNDLLPYGANFAAVLYRCSDDHMVQLFQNENVLKIENEEYLSWSNFVRNFAKFSNADFNFCDE